MNEPIKPKLKPKDTRQAETKPESVFKPVVEVASEVAQSVVETGAPPALDHMAELHGLGLLTELAKMGDVLVGARHGNTAAKPGPAPVDPRKQVDPRTRIKPR